MLDSILILKDAGLVAESAAGTVDDSAQILNLGDGKVEAEMQIDVSAIEIASNDEIYSIALQGSDTSDFTTGTPVIEELAVLNLGAAEMLSGNQDSGTGRYILPVTNEKAGTVFPYVRLYTTVDGTIATGINFKAWLR